MATLAPCQDSLNVAEAHGLRVPSIPKLAVKDELVTSQGKRVSVPWR